METYLKSLKSGECLIAVARSCGNSSLFHYAQCLHEFDMTIFVDLRLMIMKKKIIPERCFLCYNLWQCHCESSLGSSEWKLLCDRWPPTCRSSCWPSSPLLSCYRPSINPVPFALLLNHRLILIGGRKTWVNFGPVFVNNSPSVALECGVAGIEPAVSNHTFTWVAVIVVLIEITCHFDHIVVLLM